jgi:hypothetical protein
VENCTVFHAIGIEYRVRSIELERKVVEREYNFHLIVAVQQIIFDEITDKDRPRIAGQFMPETGDHLASLSLARDLLPLL